uniref:Uncharacterized protein n=1 Tax=Arundo donax TaxID=35708 RepID=A0A0A9BI86_ARUDO
MNIIHISYQMWWHMHIQIHFICIRLVEKTCLLLPFSLVQIHHCFWELRSGMKQKIK